MTDPDGLPNAESFALERWASQVVKALPLPTFVLDAEHRVVYWNSACERLTGLSAAAVLGTTRAWSAFYQYERPVMADLALTGSRLEDLERFYSGKYRPSSLVEGGWDLEDFLPNMPNGGKWLVFSAAALRDDTGNIVGAVETLRDVTAQRVAEQAVRESAVLLSEIVQGCPVPIFVIDAAHRITHWNRACESIVGTPAAKMLGSSEHWRPFYNEPRPLMADLVLDSKPGEVSKFYAHKCQPSPLISGAWEAKDYFSHFPGGGRWLYFTAAPLRGTNGQIIGAVETLQDISEQKNYEAQLESQARQDTLTGLANRWVLEERLKLALSQAARGKQLVAVAFIDLDGFKLVNDQFGHAIGDLLLREVAKRLTATVRDIDTVARLGGDEFVVVLSALNSIEAVEQIVQRTIEIIQQPVDVPDQRIQVGCSIGIAFYPQHGSDQITLLRHADSAMYLAKADGGNRHHIYSPSKA